MNRDQNLTNHSNWTLKASVEAKKKKVGSFVPFPNPISLSLSPSPSFPFFFFRQNSPLSFVNQGKQVRQGLQQSMAQRQISGCLEWICRGWRRCMGLLPGSAADAGSWVRLNSWHSSLGRGIDRAMLRLVRAVAVDDAAGYSLARCRFTTACDEA